MSSMPTPAPVPAELPLTITLQAQEWNTVMAALNELPYKVAAPLISRIGEQFAHQVGAAMAAEAAAPPPPVEQHGTIIPVNGHDASPAPVDGQPRPRPTVKPR